MIIINLYECAVQLHSRITPGILIIIGEYRYFKAIDFYLM